MKKKREPRNNGEKIKALLADVATSVRRKQPGSVPRVVSPDVVYESWFS